MKKLGFFLVLMSLLSVFAVSASAMEEDSTAELVYFEVGRLDQAVESPWSAWALRTTFGPDDTCYRDQLDETGKILYDVIDQAMNRVGELTLKEDNSGLYFEISYQAGGGKPKLEWTESEYANYCYGAVSAYFNDHPRETVVLDGSVSRYSWTSMEKNGSLRGMKLYLVDGYVTERLSRLDAAANAFYADFVADGMKTAPELEQYRYIHDFLCRSCVYNYDAMDTDAYGNPLNTTREACEMAHNAYGALVELEYGTNEGRGGVVCQGYADAFLLLCQKVGLTCVYIVGESAYNGYFTGYSNHAWNAIKLDDGWYAVDVTWDDIDVEWPEVEASYCRYIYFADNRYFLENDEVMRDHAAYSQVQYSSISYELGAPALVTGTISDTAAWKSPYLNLVLLEGTALHTADRYISDLGDDEVTLYLTDDTVTLEALQVPEGMRLTVVGLGETAPTITREIFAIYPYTGSYFQVFGGGELRLENVILDGSGTDYAAALITVEEEAVLSLENVSITGNPAAGIDAAGTVMVSDEVNIADNSANLVLAESGKVVVTGALTGEILLTAEEDTACVFPADGYDWTAGDRAVFGTDDPSFHVSYDEEADLLRLESMYYTATGMPVRIGWAAASSAAELAGSPVCLQNAAGEEQVLRVFAAAYDSRGRMLQIKALGDGAVTLAAGETLSGLSIPTLHQKTVFCRIFVVSAAGGTPLSHVAEWDFSAA